MIKPRLSSIQRRFSSRGPQNVEVRKLFVNNPPDASTPRFRTARQVSGTSAAAAATSLLLTSRDRLLGARVFAAPNQALRLGSGLIRNGTTIALPASRGTALDMRGPPEIAEASVLEHASPCH